MLLLGRDALQDYHDNIGSGDSEEFSKQKRRVMRLVDAMRRSAAPSLSPLNSLSCPPSPPPPPPPPNPDLNSLPITHSHAPSINPPSLPPSPRTTNMDPKPNP